MADPDPIDLGELSSLAIALITLLTPADFRDVLLGDLQEDIATRPFKTRREANRWLWDQVLRSLPSLILYRLKSLTIARIALLSSAYCVAFIAIKVWDAEISRAIVGSLAAQPDPPGLAWLRTIYFSLFSSGALVAGFLTAALGFRSNERFLYNYVVSFGPIFILLNITIFYPILRSGHFESVPYLATRSLIMAVALAIGAYLFTRGRDVLRPS